MCKFLFSEHSDFFFLLFDSFILSVMCRFLLFIRIMAHFSMLNSISMSWLYILTAFIRVFSSVWFLANSLMSSIYIRWSILSSDLWSLYPSVHFLSMRLSGIIAITSSHSDSVFPWNISLWIFTSPKLFPPTVNSTLQFFKVFPDKLYGFARYLVHFNIQILSSYVRQYCVPFCNQPTPHHYYL